MRSDKRSLTAAVVFAAALSVSAFAASGRYAAPHGDGARRQGDHDAHPAHP